MSLWQSYTSFLEKVPSERVKGIEPSSPVWKTGALTVELHPHYLLIRIVYHSFAVLLMRGNLPTNTTASNQMTAESQKAPGTYH